MAENGLLLPYTYLVEVPEIGEFLTYIRAASVAGLVHITSATAEPGDLLEKKRREYRAELELFPGYRDEAPLPDLADLSWLPRVTRSAFADIKALWMVGLEDEGIWWEILGSGARRGLFRHFGRLESSIASVPERLDGQAFISRFAVPLLGFDFEQKDRSRVSELVSRGYLRSYMLEPPAALFNDTPLGPLDCGLGDDASATVYSFRTLLQLAEYVGVSQAISSSVPLTAMLGLRSDPVWSWFVEVALREQLDPARPLHAAMLDVRVAAAGHQATSLVGVRDCLWRFEQAVREKHEEILGAVEAAELRDSIDAARASQPIITIHGDVIDSAIGVGNEVTHVDSRQTLSIENYWADLSAALRREGLPSSELAELRRALEADEGETDPKDQGRAARRWFIGVVKKVGDGAYSVALDLVARHLEAHGIKL